MILLTPCELNMNGVSDIYRMDPMKNKDGSSSLTVMNALRGGPLTKENSRMSCQTCSFDDNDHLADSMVETDESTLDGSSCCPEEADSDENDFFDTTQEEAGPQNSVRGEEDEQTNSKNAPFCLRNCCAECRQLILHSTQPEYDETLPSSSSSPSTSSSSPPSTTASPHQPWWSNLFCPPSELLTSLTGTKSKPVLPTYTLCQVRQHDRADSAWIIAGKNVYDVTPYLSYHPGGVNSLLRRAGGRQDCTRDLQFHSKQGQKQWDQFKIGRLVPCPATPQSQTKG